MYNSFFRNITFLGVGLSAALILAILFIKGWIWSAGILTGSVWVFLNSFFLYQLFEMGFHPALDTRNSNSFVKGGVNSQPKNKEKILIFSVLKFPVLYLSGFFILRTRFFPVVSLLLGVTVYFVALGIAWMRFNFEGARTEKSVS